MVPFAPPPEIQHGLDLVFPNERFELCAWLSGSINPTLVDNSKIAVEKRSSPINRRDKDQTNRDTDQAEQCATADRARPPGFRIACRRFQSERPFVDASIGPKPLSRGINAL